MMGMLAVGLDFEQPQDGTKSYCAKFRAYVGERCENQMLHLPKAENNGLFSRAADLQNMPQIISPGL